jgi:hypothetical protein
MAAELAEGLQDASDELGELSRGIHPTILAEAGRYVVMASQGGAPAMISDDGWHAGRIDVGDLDRASRLR